MQTRSEARFVAWVYLAVVCVACICYSVFSPGLSSFGPNTLLESSMELEHVAASVLGIAVLLWIPKPSRTLANAVVGLLVLASLVWNMPHWFDVRTHRLELIGHVAVLIVPVFAMLAVVYWRGTQFVRAQNLVLSGMLLLWLSGPAFPDWPSA